MAQPGQFRPPNDENWIGREIADIKRQMQQDRAANHFAPMGILPRQGGIDVQGFVNSLRANGTKGVAMDDDGVFIVYNAAGTTPVARFGPLDNSAPGQYGVEVLVGTTWVQLGAQSTTWDTVSGKPGWSSNPTSIAGTNISGTVPASTEAAHALDADGSVRAYNTEPAGTGSYYAVWVDANQKLCRNTSSIAYKENVRAHNLDPASVLELQPVIYDRKAGGSNEYGLIAEQVQEHVPELVQWFGGKVDGVRYELLPVALLDVVRDQEDRIRALEGREPLPPRLSVPNVPAPGAPDVEPKPLPYTIEETA
ncbi:tail fiber domain-containing protein [Pseudarthrobacter sp. MDT3-1]